jgi:hypothetical protein
VKRRQVRLAKVDQDDITSAIQRADLVPQPQRLAPMMAHAGPAGGNTLPSRAKSLRVAANAALESPRLLLLDTPSVPMPTLMPADPGPTAKGIC